MKAMVVAVFILLTACSSAGEPVSTSATASLTVTTTTPPTTASTPSTTTTLPPLAAIAYTEIAAGLPFPILVTFRPSDGVTFIATKDGQVWTLESERPTPFLDISDRVTNSGEQGLLGMVWHPTDPTRMFLHYTDLNGDTNVSE